MRWPWQRREQEGAHRVMDDPGAPLACSHCGAVWDDRHRRGECGVGAATARVLEGYEPRRPRTPSGVDVAATGLRSGMRLASGEVVERVEDRGRFVCAVLEGETRLWLGRSDRVMVRRAEFDY